MSIIKLDANVQNSIFQIDKSGSNPNRSTNKYINRIRYAKMISTSVIGHDSLSLISHIHSSKLLNFSISSNRKFS